MLVSFFLSSSVGGNWSLLLWFARGGVCFFLILVCGIILYFFYIRHFIRFDSPTHDSFAVEWISYYPPPFSYSSLPGNPQVGASVLLFICTVVRTTLLDFRYCFLLLIKWVNCAHSPLFKRIVFMPHYIFFEKHYYYFAKFLFVIVSGGEKEKKSASSSKCWSWFPIPT